jgi:hypothetical protein
LTTTVKTDGAYAPRAMLGAHGYEADPPVFAFGGSNFLVGYLVFSPLVYLVFSNV